MQTAVLADTATSTAGQIYELYQDLEELKATNKFSIFLTGAGSLYERSEILSPLATTTAWSIAGCATAYLGLLTHQAGLTPATAGLGSASAATLYQAGRHATDLSADCLLEGYYTRVCAILDKHLSTVVDKPTLDSMKNNAREYIGHDDFNGLEDMLRGYLFGKAKDYAWDEAWRRLGWS